MAARARHRRQKANFRSPGWVWTNMTARGDLSQPKPSGAWTAEQTVEYMFEHVLEHGDFYVICPDNETNTKLDKARIQWALGDIIENRPALSRWHPECERAAGLGVGLADTRRRRRQIRRVRRGPPGPRGAQSFARPPARPHPRRSPVRPRGPCMIGCMDAMSEDAMSDY